MTKAQLEDQIKRKECYIDELQEDKRHLQSQVNKLDEMREELAKEVKRLRGDNTTLSQVCNKQMGKIEVYERILFDDDLVTSDYEEVRYE